jgi:hypothetical protein
MVKSFFDRSFSISPSIMRGAVLDYGPFFNFLDVPFFQRIVSPQ